MTKHIVPFIHNIKEQGEIAFRLIIAVNSVIDCNKTHIFFGKHHLGVKTDFEINNNTYVIRKGDIFFVAPEAPHKYAPVKKPWMVKYIIFSGSEVENIFRSLKLPASGAVSFSESTEVERLVNMIFDIYESGKRSRHIKASSVLYRLLVLISSEVEENEGARAACIERLEKALKYINNSFGDRSLSSDTLSENSGISHPHLCRLFRTAFGMSPHDYIVNTRIEHAKYLLCSEKNMTVRAVSDKCGFNSTGYFIRVFKSKTGLTPIEFRNQNIYTF